MGSMIPLIPPSHLLGERRSEELRRRTTPDNERAKKAAERDARRREAENPDDPVVTKRRRSMTPVTRNTPLATPLNLGVGLNTDAYDPSEDGRLSYYAAIKAIRAKKIEAREIEE